jgi:hypothetical protein
MNQKFITDSKDLTEGPTEHQLGAFLNDLISLRGAFDTFFPIRNSLIAWDILVEVLLAHSRGRKLQVKALLGELPHSRTGIDYHYRWLIDEGWIELVPCDKDKRVRYACPSQRLLESLHVMMSHLEGKLHHFPPVTKAGR